MKKLFVALLAVGLLASCNKPANTDTTKTTDTKATESTTTDTKATESTATESTATQTATSGNSCESYYAYMTCAYKKSGMTDAATTEMVDQVRTAMKSMPNSEEACSAAVKEFKEHMPTEGC